MSRTSFAGRIAIAAAILLAASASIATAQSGAAQGKAPEETGLVVVSVNPGSPAEKAGIARGDIILSADGKDVNGVRELYAAVASRKSGDTLSLKIKHGDAQRSLTATLTEQNGRTYLGVMPYPAGGWYGRWQERWNEDWPRHMGAGVFIESVAKGSPAEKAGLKEGEAIESVDGVKVGPGDDLTALIQKRKAGDTVTLSVRSQDKGTREVKVALEKNPQKADTPYLGVQYDGRGFGPMMREWDRRGDGPRGPMHGRGPGRGYGPMGMMDYDEDGPDCIASPLPDARGI